MKSLTRLFCAAAFLFTVAAPASALWGMGDSVQGEIQSVSGDMITVQKEQQNPDQQGEQIQLKVNDQTDFGELSSVDDLKQGDQVEIKYNQEGQDNIATQVSRQESQAPQAQGQQDLQGQEAGAGEPAI